MSRYTIFADVAGQRSLATAGSDRMTAAAVAIHASDKNLLCDQISQLPKWRDCSLLEAQTAVDIFSNAAAISIVSMTKDPEHWPDFWAAAKPLQDAIVARDRKPAGFVRPANVALFALLMHVYGIAIGHAVKVSRGVPIIDYRGMELVERTIVCDTDIQGEENLAVFKAFFERSDRYQPRMAKLGFRFVTREVIVTTEEHEPLLLLADYAAGIGHSAHITDPGRIPLPVVHHEAKKLLQKLDRTGKLVILSKPFDIDYAEIFGDVLQ
jgi:hypothetical protein